MAGHGVRLFLTIMNPVVKTLDQHKKANKEITATTANMAAIYRQAREWLNNQLRKFVLSKGRPSEGKWLVELINELERNYGKLEESFVAEMKRAIPYVAEGYYFDALHDLGNSVLGKIDKNKIEIFQKDAFNHIAGMTQNMIKSDVAFIRQASADVFRLAGVNGMTAEQTKEMLLGKILTRPEKFQFVDAGGHVWDNESYCKMLSRTVLLNAGRQSYFDACAANGNDVVRVTVSGNPCPACAVWENRLLSISGATDGLPTVEQATAAGLCHPNCTHSFVAVGEFARQEDFSADGRPKEGVNSPGREEKDNPEAWKKYRKSLKPEKARKSPSTAQKQQPASTTPATPEKLPQATAKPANGTSAMVQPNLPLNGPAQPAAPANQPAKKETPEEHRAKRQAQLERARENRIQREADLIGAKRLKGEHTREEDLKAVNPNYTSRGEGVWENNCQRCVAAYEARRRGIDVTAKPKPSMTDYDELSRSCGWADSFVNAKPIDCSDTTGLKARANIIREMENMPDGARCAVQVLWRGRGGRGHVFIAEKHDGKITFIDPQPHGEPRQLDMSERFREASGKLVYVMRLDNLKFSDTVKECCTGG